MATLARPDLLVNQEDKVNQVFLVFQDHLVLPQDNQDLRDQLVLQALVASLVLRVRLEMLDQREIQDRLEIRDQEGRLVPMGLQVSLELRDLLGVLGIVVIQDHAVSQELLVYPDHRELLEDQVNKGHKVPRVNRDLMVPLVLWGLVVAQDQ